MSSQASQLISDYLGAKKMTREVVNMSFGWETHVNRPDVPGPFEYLYLYEHKTKFLWACTMSKENFLSFRDNEFNVEQASSLLGSIVSDVVNAPDMTNEGLQNHLGIAIAMYVTKTKSYALMPDDMKKGPLHMVIISYPDPVKSANRLVRPFIMANLGDHLINMDKLDESIQKVVKIDQENHPEWFRGSPKGPRP